MKKTIQIKLPIVMLLLMIMQSLPADDTEIFLDASSNPPDPKVMFLMDNSTSMTNGSGQTRMSIAKEVLLDIVHNPDNSELDIGVAALSRNYEGGKIIAAIDNLTASSRGSQPTYTTSSHGSCTPTQPNTLTQKICDIKATGHTQLEETYWETYLYYMGSTPLFGNIADNATPPIVTDTNALSGSTYFSPIFEDSSLLTDISGDGSLSVADDLSCQTNYIVVMTDGAHSGNDKSANDEIRALSGSTCSGGTKCMSALAGYISNNDLDGDATNDIQNIVTYTVGFHSSGNTLLQSVATAGKGEAFEANNASELSTALNTIFTNISSTTSSFASPSSASSASNDARSLNYIYSSVFEPGSTPRWSGNLKKYRLDTVQNGFEVDGTTPKYEFTTVDVNNKIVYDSTGKVISIANGNGTYDVQSIWSSSADTDIVEAGGAGASISNYATRTVYTNSDHDADNTTVDLLTDFKTTNTYLTHPQFGDDVTNDTEKDELINWARGKDSDGSTRWVMGDSLHSTPTVINYGKRENLSMYEGDFSDVRIAMGTNAGFLHFFKDDLGGVDGTNVCSSGSTTNGICNGYTKGDKVSESWAFIPDQLLDNIKDLKTNSSSSSHPYGVDGEIAVYTVDKNQDGNIVSSEGDHVFIVFGMRRGGYYYYALNITDPDNPTFLWKFTNSDNADGNEILQTWSKPQFGKIKYFDGTDVQIRTVAIVTAGYDTDKDAKATVGTNDDDGRGLFMIDVYSREVLWSVLNGVNGDSTEKILYESTLNDSIPATPRTIDLNDDGILDRIYMGDTGGNIWRIDLVNQDVETAYKTTPPPSVSSRGKDISLDTGDSRKDWTIVKLATLGRGDPDISGLANDRRFFNQPDFVQTRDKTRNFDAILIGSGHRNNPNETNIDNRFYMIKDPNVVAYKFQSTTCSDDTKADYDPHCKKEPSEINNSDLTEATNTTLSAHTTNGWKLDLEESGEKSLSSSVTLSGSVNFTTYSPAASSGNLCTLQAGTSYLYSIDLHTASAKNDSDEDGTVESIADRIKSIKSPGIPGKPSLFSPDGKKLYIVPGVGEEPMYVGDLKTQIYYWFKNSE